MSGEATPQPVANRTLITISILLASVMTTLDSTIANVALPRIAGSLSASPDQVSWVLTSYIIAIAIVTPITGWLAGRIGAKYLVAISVVGFTIASALCGASQSLGQIVVCRILQGAFGAAVGPLAQMVLFDTYAPEERGPVMSLWGMGTVMAPIFGPILGGWLTNDFDWRWVFYINLPLGALSLFGVLAFMPGGHKKSERQFDLIGFGLLSTALAGFQLMLDRGQGQDWFQSTEIIIETSVAGLALLLFCFHTATCEHPFVPVGLLKDRNFVISITMTFVMGVVMFAVLAIMPPMMESLLGYPVLTAGIVLSPRGIGTMISIFLAGRLVGRIDDRLLIVAGLVLFSFAYWIMSHFSLTVTPGAIGTSGLIMGLGTGLVFMPTILIGFATLNPALRGDGVGVSALMRNLGNSVGISILETILTRNTQIVHSRLTENLTRDNPLARPPYLAPGLNFGTPTGLAGLNGEVTRQATMVAYADVYHMLIIASWIMVPLLLLIRPAKTADRVQETLVIE